ncbi:MAG TPA: peroxiredoxin-like family protein [Roseiarcus sp.]|nr:peroxiredoxin-like family protein [Roseiarcus sp.]
MAEHHAEGPLQPGDRAPNIVLDAITRDGKIALDDFRGRTPVLVGLFRGLHCPFCRRHIAAMARLDPALRDRGVETFAVVNSPTERARLYYRYHPLPNLLAAADPERASHRAFGLPMLEFTENETVWPRKVGMDVVLATRVNVPGELDQPMNPIEAGTIMNQRDGYEISEAERKMLPASNGQLVGEFLLDREGIIRWSFTEVAEGGRNMFGAPTPDELMSAAAQVAR